MKDFLSVLAFETSCDETAVCWMAERLGSLKKDTTEADRKIRSGTQDDETRPIILARRVFSQIEQHESFGGVVPELAARAHAVKLDVLFQQVVEEARQRAREGEFSFLGKSAGKLIPDAIAVTRGPGLVGALNNGVVAAKMAAIYWSLPLIFVNHLEGHVLSPKIEQRLSFPYLALLVSGGHSQWVAATGVAKYEIIGATQDDALGEAFDKVAKVVGLPYPGGPHVEKAAQRFAHKVGFCYQRRREYKSFFSLPRPLAGSKQPNFSFSGLKTAFVRCYEKHCKVEGFDLTQLLFEFQLTIADVIEDRLSMAMKVWQDKYAEPLDSLCLVGGVSANKFIRSTLSQFCGLNGITLTCPGLWLCGDNADMIAYAAIQRIKGNLCDMQPLDCNSSNLSVGVEPRLSLVEGQKNRFI